MSCFLCVIVGINADCVDSFDVQKEGDSQMGNSRQMIVPQPYFFCDGRINGLIVSLDLDDDNDVEYPYIQVWRNFSSMVYTLVGQYQLQEDDISRRQNYYLANVTLTGANRIEFQSGDVIGYYHPSRPRYLVWSVENIRGYTIHSVSSQFPFDMFNISRDSRLSVSQDERPLIQALYGKYKCKHNNYIIYTYVCICQIFGVITYQHHPMEKYHHVVLVE